MYYCIVLYYSVVLHAKSDTSNRLRYISQIFLEALAHAFTLDLVQLFVFFYNAILLYIYNHGN